MTPASKAIGAAPKPAGQARKGVQLNPADPGDQQIITRQVKAARQAGREGRDRARTTRGRSDLEEAFDEGAAEDDGQEDNGEDSIGPGRGRRAWQSVNSGSWSAFKPRDPRRAPTRVADAGGLLTGMLLYTGVVVYLRYGPAGWKGWLAAKFLNRPMASQGEAGAPAGTGKKKEAAA